MSVVLFKRFALAGCVFAGVAVIIGCGQSSSNSSSPQVSEVSHEDHDHDEGEHAEDVAGDHSDWWCSEHGVPEEVCSICSSKAAANFKEKEDWCEEHNRAESQCFKCDPSRAEKFAKLYEAKIGGKPPAITD